MSDAQAGRRYVEGEQDGYGQAPYSRQQPQYPPQYPGYQQGQDPYGGGYPPQQQEGYPGYYSEPGYYPQQQPYPPQQYPEQYPQQNYPQQPQQQPGYPQQQQPQQYPHIPQQQTAPRHDEPAGAPATETGGEAERDFKTEQFAFIEEDDEQAEDVIDWLKFTESRTERREEAKRRGRKRVTALIVLLVLALIGGVGYLWQSGRLPGLGGGGSQAAQAPGAQKRDVIVVHLRPVDSPDSSTALLVGNETTGKGTTVLVPNSLVVNTDGGGTTTLGKSVVNDGEGPTRDSLNTLLGANIQGTWRLDTPFLEILVDSLGDITLDTDATVSSGGKTLVTAGRGQDLDGRAAVAYATYRAPGESQDRQLARFGQVMQAVLAKMPSDAATATKTVQNLGSIPDPSLSDAQLGATLAQLAEQAKTGHYATTTLPVQANGTLSRQATDDVVKSVLGGAVKSANPGGTPTVSVRNATGRRTAASSAQVSVVNSGDTYVDGGTATGIQTRSQVVYGSDANAQTARELAKTLGLPDTAVTKGTVGGTADISVVLGTDYKG